MNYLTALLAFAAIMIVLTTLATVVVEGIHRLTRKRAADFEHLALQLYENAIKPSLLEKSVSWIDANAKDDNDADADAVKFVEQLTRNPAFDPNRKGILERAPLLKNLFDKSFQELTTRQFVEQFAQTDAGKALQEAGQLKARELVSKFSYEFERYGEAASSYFTRRASILSVGVAFILAFSLNFDAFKLFEALARDNNLSTQVIASVDVAKIESAYLARMNSASSSAEALGISEEFQSILDEIRTESADLQRMGLPIGLAYFPYCQDPRGDSGGSPSTGNVKTPAGDPRCNAIPESSDFTVSWPLIGTPVTAVGRFFVNAASRLSSPAGFGWIIAVLVSGGMIGLGAPFWFKTYQFVVDFVPGAKKLDGTLSRQQRSGKTAATTGVATGTPQAPVSGGFIPGPVLNVGTENSPSGSTPPASDPPIEFSTGFEAKGLEVMSDLGLSDDELLMAFSQTRPAPKQE